MNSALAANPNAAPDDAANTAPNGSPMAARNGLLAIIGGSGLYELPGLRDTAWVAVPTPWGEPSDQILTGTLPTPAGPARLAFLPRHGRGHRLAPSAINYRANIAALKILGATDVLSLSAVGSLRADLPPGTFVIVDQFIDRTVAREKSFFGPGLVAHVSMARPVCQRLGDHLQAALEGRVTGQSTGQGTGQGTGQSTAPRTAPDVRSALPVPQVPHVRGGTYLAMEGPQFSTLAESRLYRSWNCDCVGMTNMPEAALAREAELCYASVAMVTDFDCWHAQHADVTVQAIVLMLGRNADAARALVADAAGTIAQDPAGATCACRHALDHALITAPGARDPAVVQRLRGIAGRVL